MPFPSIQVLAEPKGTVLMTIVFFCQSCGSRFEVGKASAGKQGNCKKCGQRMIIPKPTQLASMVAMPAILAGGLETVASAAPPSVTGPDWLAQVNSNVKLAPLTVQGMQGIGGRGAIKPKLSPFMDSASSALYTLAKGGEVASRGRPQKQGGNVMTGLNSGLGLFQKLARMLNEFAYLASIPFLMMILSGAVFKSRNLALFGATVVVLLNLGRIVTGVFGLAIIPLRQGIGQLFNWKKMRRPVQRITVPAITIGAVLLAFMFIPRLSRDGSGLSLSGDPKDQLRASFLSLQEDINEQLEQTKNLDLRSIQDKAGPEFEKLRAQLTEKIQAARKAHSSSESMSTTPINASTAPLGDSLTDLVKQLRQLNGEMSEIQKSP